MQASQNSKCSICRHGGLAIVEAALLDSHSRASVATRYGVGRMSVNKHAANGMAPPEVTAKLKRSIAKARKRAEDGARDCVRGDRALGRRRRALGYEARLDLSSFARLKR